MIQRDENLSYHPGAVAIYSCLIAQSAGGYQDEWRRLHSVLAIEYINVESPLAIINGDQIIRADVTDGGYRLEKRKLDGGIIVFEDVHPRWSFVKCGRDGLVVEAAEKRPISRLARRVSITSLVVRILYRLRCR